MPSFLFSSQDVLPLPTARPCRPFLSGPWVLPLQLPVASQQHLVLWPCRPSWRPAEERKHAEKMNSNIWIGVHTFVIDDVVCLRHMSVFSPQSWSMGLLDSRHRPLLLACFLPFARTNCSLATQQLYVVLLCCSRCVPADEETTIKNVTVHVLLWTVLRFLPTAPSTFRWCLFLLTCPELPASIGLWKKTANHIIVKWRRWWTVRFVGGLIHVGLAPRSCWTPHKPHQLAGHLTEARSELGSSEILRNWAKTYSSVPRKSWGKAETEERLREKKLKGCLMLADSSQTPSAEYSDWWCSCHWDQKEIPTNWSKDDGSQKQSKSFVLIWIKQKTTHTEAEKQSTREKRFQLLFTVSDEQ